MKKLLLLLLPFSVFAQNEISVYPPNWWVGFENDTLQLLVRGENVGVMEAGLVHPTVQIISTETVTNPNYQIVNLLIKPNTEPGILKLKFNGSIQLNTVDFELKARDNDRGKRKGLKQTDLMYLVFPDRFANGDTSNDTVAGMADNRIIRDSMFVRHGGDLAGLKSKLDYIKDLGATAIWINPILENNMPIESYHGYAYTDHYKIDPRFGSNQEYVDLVAEAQRKGIKIVNDIVFNHVGTNHWMFQDMPDKTWFNWWPEFQKTSYRAPTLLDPHAAEADRKIMSDGWFVHHMPDLNQRNQFVANYLIQNSIWWVETAGFDAYRIDTYAYSDQDFMREWAKAVNREYPAFNFFGETWVHGTPIQSFFTQNTAVKGNFDSHLPGVTDFQAYYAINEALTKPMGWTEGVAKLYYTLAKDGVYEDANRNVIFLDNHDLSRYYSMVGEDFDKWKMGIAWLMTCRGIPMIYYGTEILMKNFADPDGKVREDFPGGWKGDASNKFTKSGRTAQEQQAFDYVKKLANYRRANRVMAKGKLIQFVPEDGLYVYFRMSDAKRIMVIMNTSEDSRSVDVSRFAECILGAKSGKEITSGESQTLTSDFKVEGTSVWVLELN